MAPVCQGDSGLWQAWPCMRCSDRGLNCFLGTDERFGSDMRARISDPLQILAAAGKGATRSERNVSGGKEFECEGQASSLDAAGPSKRWLRKRTVEGVDKSRCRSRDYRRSFMGCNARTTIPGRERRFYLLRARPGAYFGPRGRSILSECRSRSDLAISRCDPSSIC